MPKENLTIQHMLSRTDAGDMAALRAENASLRQTGYLLIESLAVRTMSNGDVQVLPQRIDGTLFKNAKSAFEPKP